MFRRTLIALIACSLFLTAASSFGGVMAKPASKSSGTKTRAREFYGRPVSGLRSVTNEQRRAAAERAKARRAAQPQSRRDGGVSMPGPGGFPDYFGTTPNYANSPYPMLDAQGNVVPNTGIRKFVNGLPGLGAAGANNLGQYIPVAAPIKDANGNDVYPGSDYYEIGLTGYSQQLHADVPATPLRGYFDRNPLSPDGNAPHYLGPVIIAQKDRAVRVKFSNLLGTGAAGDLPLPVDTTAMGAGMAPDGSMYPQNRATLHLHGGNTPWISDGTPHQWTVPAGENTAYKKGVATQNVPDMPAAGDGEMTFYWPNQQSGRLMFYHDHAYGITRLNVYAGEAAGYLVWDQLEEDMVSGTNVSGKNPSNAKVIPDPAAVTGNPYYHFGIPLIVQDKTFVDAAAIPNQDPTWNWGLDSNGQPVTGSLWFPHVYMPNQWPTNPDDSGTNPMGRWDYGPWFWPPYTGLKHPPIVGDGINGCPVGQTCPAMPNPSLVPEAFMDTPLVNGAAYPTVTLPPAAFRFRILNAANDRTMNLSLFYATDANGVVCMPGNATTGACTEVKMVDAVKHKTDPNWPPLWPSDGREGGVPDPYTSGPSWIQIGTEGGFLPAPAIIPPQPIDYNYNRRDVVVLNVTSHSLMLGPAERADVIVDFSQVPSGSTLILYNDAPAPVPAFDTRNDYYTGDPDQSGTGGAPTTIAGYGPNTRTIMQIVISGTPSAPFDVTALNTAFQSTASGQGAFQALQPTVLVPEAAYGSAYNSTFRNNYVHISDNSLTFTPIGASAPTTATLLPKAIQELFDPDWGRMNATLGVEIPNTSATTQTTIPYWYVDPPTEVINTGETQLWKITHNGVDTHAIHFHLMNVQLINRVGWDGAIRGPDPNELGWKETVRMNPLEDIVVALQPMRQTLPFPVPDSNRLFDVTTNQGSTGQFTNMAPDGSLRNVTNDMTNFAWEYVWHCHLLGHEENDMMRPIVFVVPPDPPLNLTATWTAGNVQATFTDNSLSENGYTLQRSTDPAFPATGADLQNIPLPGTVSGYGQPVTFNDGSTQIGLTYYYRAQAYGTNGTSVWSNTASIARVPLAVVSQPAGLVFGNQLVNTTSMPLTFTLTNSGAAPLNIVSVGFTGANFDNFAQTNDCGASLDTGLSCTFSVTFTPSATGARSANLVITSNDSKNPQLAVPLSGTGTQPVASLSTASLTFAAQLVNTASAAQTFTVSNNGTADLTLGSITFSGANAADFVQSGCGSTVAIGASCTISVTFTPSASGVRTATLTVNGNDPVNLPATVSLSGTGIQPVATLSATAISFGNQLTGTTSAGQTITLSNTGTADLLNINVTLSGANASDFVLTNACGATLAIGAPCDITVTFKPSAMGSRIASLGIDSSDPVNPHLAVSVNGVGVQPVAGVSPASVAFGDQFIKTASAIRQVTLSNTGTADLLNINVVVTGTNASDYSMTNACGSTLAAGASCVVDLTFTPPVSGNSVASLDVSSSDPVNPIIGVALSGTGVQPVAGVSTTALAFGNQLVNTSSAAQTVTLSNSGTVALNVNSIVLSGANAADFVLSNSCGTSVAIGGSCSLSVTFKPTAAGPLAASLLVNSNDPVNPQLTVALSGTGIRPIAGISPALLTFAGQLVTTTSPAQALVLSNTGDAPLTINSIAFSGAQPSDFAQSNNCGASLAAGANCSIDVTFTPSASGARAASLTIDSNDPANPQLVVAVSGSGIQPVAGISAASLAFGSQLVNTSSAVQTLTLSNTGTADLLNIAVSLTGANAGDFSMSNACGATLAVAASCDISVTFKPLSSGAKVASITIASSDLANPQLISALSGTGTQPIAGIAPAVVAFGNQLVGTTSASQSVTLSNSGTTDLQNISLALSGANAAEFGHGACPASLAPGASCTITLTFTPAVTGARSASLDVTSNDAFHSPLSVALSGTGTQPIAGVSPASLSFGNQRVGQVSASQGFTLSNTGTGDLTINSIVVDGANPADFAQTNSCGATLAAGGSCTFTVTFNPTVAAARSASVTLNSNDPANPVLGVTLSGTGTQPVAAIAPGSLTFATQLAGTSSASQALTLSNTGSAALAVSGISITGANPGDFSQTNGCGASVAAGGSCTITVTFKPVDGGARNASVTVTSDDPAHPTLTASLTGTGTAITITPTSLTFASQLVATTSAGQTITVKNIGISSITLSGISITGANANDFTTGFSTTCGTSLAGGATCTVTVKYKPGARGASTGSVSINDSDPTSPQSVALSGTGIAPVNSVWPLSLTFNSPLNIKSASQTATVTNTGDASMTISSISLKGANPTQFAQTTTCGTTLAVNASCTVTVTFTPTTWGTGVKTANLSVTVASPAVSQTVSLTGNVTAPTFSLTPSSLDFGSQTVNTTSAAKTVTLTNTSALASLSLTSVTLTGANAGSYAQTNACPTSLAAGQTCAINVTFTPRSKGTKTASVSVKVANPTVTQTASLTGSGK